MICSRFLRARRFVPQEAFKQFKDTEDWRKDQNINELFEIIEAEEYEQTRQLVTTSCSFSLAALCLTAALSTLNGLADAISAVSRCTFSRSLL